MTMPFAKHSAAIFDHEFRGAAGHVNSRGDRFALAINRPHDPGAGRFGAIHQRGKPIGRHQRVVVDEHDVFGPHLRGRHIARRIWRQIMLGPNELKPLLGGLLLEIIAHRGRRATVDVDQFKRSLCVRQNALKRSLRKAESFARYDGHRSERIGHYLLLRDSDRLCHRDRRAADYDVIGCRGFED